VLGHHCKFIPECVTERIFVDLRFWATQYIILYDPAWHALSNCRVVKVKPNTHRRRRRDATVELSRVGGVNAPVGSRDPVYNSAAIMVD